jgi:hypothetical protein
MQTQLRDLFDCRAMTAFQNVRCKALSPLARIGYRLAA